MITITIDNPELEKVFHENNLDYSRKFSVEEIAYYEAAYDEGVASGDSGLTHEEVFEQLFQKYDSK